MTPATYKDIQRLTGLSLATISKHFNGGSVREHNRLAIESAAEQLDFRVNAVARSLRTRRSRTVGVLLPELRNDFHLSIVAGVEAALRREGVGVLVCSSHRADAPSAGGVDFLLDHRVDGIIAVPSAHDRASLVAAAGRGLPLVVVDRLVPGLRCDAVVLDNARASALVVEHLLAAGHRDLAVVTGTADVWSMRGRLAGFTRAVRAAGLALEPRRTVTGPLTVEAGREGVRSLLALEQRPTAIYATNHELMLGALIALNESGLEVPRQVSFVGFDGREVAAVSRPRTAVLVQPVQEIAAAAAELMRERLHLPEGARRAPRRLVLPGAYAPGGSVGPPPR
ncbi:LacI family DNA-binding transcriptional regulator [Kineococcus indalonis]|uniref:LacI family DNA-binding transcriptional regulator n=1 Tax=Kineococcus indalonis TaxID=2696566 RepID=UPI0014125A09|nr:LacI family DNA-binding transcriptional regulator [Kineococcus indalonis]NAZ88167.1 substrate-binding domain-containing protein [Kineococcus indalonis]